MARGKPRQPKPMEFYTTDACCPACKERHGFFAPSICGHNNQSRRNVWYDRSTCTWTTDNPFFSPPSALARRELEAAE